MRKILTRSFSVWLALLGWAGPFAVAQGREAQAQECVRVVSLSPSVTEMLYSLELGPAVKGATRYCHFPPEVEVLPRVGGFLDVNYEAVLALKPDRVFVVSEMRDKGASLAKLGLAVVELDHRSVRGIKESLLRIGQVCGRQTQAAQVLAQIDERVARVQRKVAGAARVRTLIVVGDGSPASGIRGLFVSGQDGFYDELLDMAGGTNVFKNTTASVPALAAEGLLALNPDLILHVTPGSSGGAPQLNQQQVSAMWSEFPSLAAVRQGRVFLLQGDYVVTPGPRFPRLLEDMAHVLHPEISWD